MKSLLVDVLRQAQDESSEDNPPPTREGRLPNGDLTGTEGAVNAADLDLLATGQFRTEEAVTGDDAEQPSVAMPEEPADADEPPLPDPRGPMANTTVLSELGAVLQSKPPTILRVGRMTPLICLVAVAGVAAGSLFVNRVTSSSLNDGLDENSNIGQAADPNGATDRAALLSKVFSAAPENGNTAIDTSTISPTPAATVVAGPASDSTVAGSPGPETTIDAGRPVAGRNAVDDRAFELVAAGYAAYQQRDYGRAERYYDQALTLEANHRDALLGIAAVYGQTDRDAQAIDAYRKVLQIEPGNTIAASAILSARSASARWENESDLKLLLQQFPDAHHLHFALGSIYVGEERWAAARHAFLAAWQLAPATPEYAYNLAVSFERLGDVVEAARYYETALAYADDASNVDRAAVEMHLNQLAIIARDDR